jgi:hypothetical protein
MAGHGEALNVLQGSGVTVAPPVQLANIKEDILSLPICRRAIPRCHHERGPIVWVQDTLENWKQKQLHLREPGDTMLHFSRLEIGDSHEWGWVLTWTCWQVLNSRELRQWWEQWLMALPSGKEGMPPSKDHCRNKAPSLWLVNCLASGSWGGLAARWDRGLWDQVLKITPFLQDPPSHRVVNC